MVYPLVSEMHGSDCGKCKREVNRRSKKWISCERCDDWYHMDCVGLGRVNERDLRCKNLLFLCDECLPKTKEEWLNLTVRSEAVGSDTEEGEEGEAGSARREGAQGKGQPQATHDHTYCDGKESDRKDEEDPGRRLLGQLTPTVNSHLQN